MSDLKEMTSALDGLDKCGFIQGSTPVTSHPSLAESLGVSSFHIKRDDLSEALCGGTKPRKLDYLLAHPPFASAPAWHGLGAIGSGQLVALTEAARVLDRQLVAQTFWSVPDDKVLSYLAFIASGPTEVRYQRTRVGTALRRPGLMLLEHYQGKPVIPPGATHPVALLGMVRAAFELAEQVKAGELPEPERLYLPLGTGGTAVGLAVGLALAGLSTQVHAISVVERAFSPRLRFVGMSKQLLNLLGKMQIASPDFKVRPLSINRSQLGRGYALPTPQGSRAIERLQSEGVELEGTYTAKAMAAMLEDLKASEVKHALFWMTAHKGDLPHSEDWRDRLPPRLLRDLKLASDPRALTRRRLWQLGGALTLSALLLHRTSGYREIEGWKGQVLSEREVHILLAAFEPLLAPAPTQPNKLKGVEAVDHFLLAMPPSIIQEIHALFHLIEHGTFLGLSFARFTRLTPKDREDFLQGLHELGGKLSEAYKGIRDLCLLAYYQEPASWDALGYEGPHLALNYDPRGPERRSFPHYEALVAPPASLPKGALR